MSLKDEGRSGRPSKLDDEDLQVALNAKKSSSNQDLLTELEVGKSAIYRRIQQLECDLHATLRDKMFAKASLW